jgi:hypothetical protein
MKAAANEGYRARMTAPADGRIEMRTAARIDFPNAHGIDQPSTANFAARS